MEPKPYRSVEQHIQLLRARGMSLEDDSARHWLGVVNYYRLSGYWYPYRREAEGVVGDEFVSGTSLSQITALYEFDRKLGTLILDAIERIEVALRAQLGETLGVHGPLGYRDPEYFRTTFKHDQWIVRAQKRVNRARGRSNVVRHHDEEYNGQIPIWVLVDLLDFSDISMLYEGLRSRDQRRIADAFDIMPDTRQLSKTQSAKVKKQQPLARWLEQFSVLRNTTAHYSRVWNANFTPAGTNALKQSIQALESLPENTSVSIYGALVIIGHMLSTISPGTTWMQKVRGLVEELFIPHTGRSIVEMGFPEDWKNHEIWCEEASSTPSQDPTATLRAMLGKGDESGPPKVFEFDESFWSKRNNQRNAD